MKKFLLGLVMVIGCHVQLHAQSMTDAERNFLVKHLSDTKAYLHEALKGLSEEQMNFKAAPERWSIKECLEHIANTELLVAQRIQEAMKLPASPEKRGEIKTTDNEIIAVAINRADKLQAPEVLKPTGKYATAQDALKAYDDQRDKTIAYIKTTKDDLRGHVSPHPRFGMIDSYQWFILVGAHQKRHTLQIEEVKADKNFPKK